MRRLVRALGLRRSSVSALKVRSERELLARVPRRPDRRPRILCYHSVGTPAWGYNDVAPDLFRRQVEWAQADGRRFVRAAEIAAGCGQEGDLAMTFDDGLTSVMENGRPVLAGHGVPWTIFVVTRWADGKHDFGSDTVLDWEQLERLGDGAEIGSHSLTHPDFGRLPTEVAVRELTESRQALEAHLGVPVLSFAIPFGQSRNWTSQAQQAAHAAGYREIYAQGERTRPPGTVARTFITGFDDQRLFLGALNGAFDRWEEWY